MNKFTKPILLIVLLSILATLLAPTISDAVATKLLLARQDDWVAGDLLVAPANPMTTGKYLVNIPDVATGNVLRSGGVATNPAWGKVTLTTHVDGILPVANGGTGSASGPAPYAHKFANDAEATRLGTTAADTIFTLANTYGTTLISSSEVEAGDIIEFEGAFTGATDSDGTEAATLDIKMGVYSICTIGNTELDTAFLAGSPTIFVKGRIIIETAGAAGAYRVEGLRTSNSAGSEKTITFYSRQTARNLTSTLVFAPWVQWYNGTDADDIITCGNWSINCIDAP